MSDLFTYINWIFKKRFYIKKNLKMLKKLILKKILNNLKVE